MRDQEKEKKICSISYSMLYCVLTLLSLQRTQTQKCERYFKMSCRTLYTVTSEFSQKKKQVSRQQCEEEPSVELKNWGEKSFFFRKTEGIERVKRHRERTKKTKLYRKTGGLALLIRRVSDEK
jgi:hypothetical protein